MLNQEQESIWARDKQASLWVHEMYIGRIMKATIQDRLNSLDEPERGLMATRLNHYVEVKENNILMTGCHKGLKK